jgi:predicted lipoprotein with Yx(FWY)xxD motif
MNVSLRAFALASAAALLAGCGTSYGSSGPSSTPTGAATLSVAGGHLVGSGGKALYLWVKDMGSMSMCTGGCAAAWPPLTATAVPTVSAPLVQSKVALTARSDGTKQVTYAGHPLYYYAADTGADDTYGQGSDSFGAKWWLVAPTGTAIMAPHGMIPPISQSPSAPATGPMNY